MSIQVVGDELHFEGYVVGMLAQAGVPATTMERLVDWLNEADIHPPLDESEPEIVEVPCEGDYDQALDDLVRAAGEYAKGGLLRMSDLANIVTQLKEETS